MNDLWNWPGQDIVAELLAEMLLVALGWLAVIWGSKVRPLLARAAKKNPSTSGLDQVGSPVWEGKKKTPALPIDYLLGYRGSKKVCGGGAVSKKSTGVSTLTQSGGACPMDCPRFTKVQQGRTTLKEHGSRGEVSRGYRVLSRLVTSNRVALSCSS
jgi:hypothetical protein